MVEYFPLIRVDVGHEQVTAVFTHLSRFLPKSVVLRFAIQSAYKKFEEQYPDWVDALFDETFLKNEASPLFAKYLKGCGNPTAAELANAWMSHLGSCSAEKEAHHVAMITPAIEDFLGWVESVYQR